MTDINKCPSCDYELEEEDDNGCPMCRAIERESNRFAEARWQQSGQTWLEFWEDCERIKGKL